MIRVPTQNLLVLRPGFGLASLLQRPGQHVLGDQFLWTGGCIPEQRFHGSGGVGIRQPRQGHGKLALGEPAFHSEGGLGLLRLALGNSQERLGPVETGYRLRRRLDGL